MAGPRLLSSRTGRSWSSARVLTAEPLAAALVFFFRLEGQLRSKLRESARLRHSPRHTERSPAPAFPRRGLWGGEQGRAERELLIGQASARGRGRDGRWPAGVRAHLPRLSALSACGCWAAVPARRDFKGLGPEPHLQRSAPATDSEIEALLPHRFPVDIQRCSIP